MNKHKNTVFKTLQPTVRLNDRYFYSIINEESEFVRSQRMYYISKPDVDSNVCVILLNDVVILTIHSTKNRLLKINTYVDVNDEIIRLIFYLCDFFFKTYKYKLSHFGNYGDYLETKVLIILNDHTIILTKNDNYDTT